MFSLNRLQHASRPVHQLLELAQTHVHRVADAIQPSHPLLSPSPPAFNFSQHQGLFQWVSPLNQVAKVWSFSFSISPSNEYSGLISLRTDWFDLLAVQGTLKSLLQQSHFKTISTSMLSFFYGPTLTSIHDYWNMFLFLPFPCDFFLIVSISWKSPSAHACCLPFLPDPRTCQS